MQDDDDKLVFFNNTKLDGCQNQYSGLIKNKNNSTQLKIHSVFFENGFDYRSGLGLEFIGKHNEILGKILFTNCNTSNDNILYPPNEIIIKFKGTDIKAQLSENFDLNNDFKFTLNFTRILSV